jgi:hypothetical protein
MRNDSSCFSRKSQSTTSKPGDVPALAVLRRCFGCNNLCIGEVVGTTFIGEPRHQVQSCRAPLLTTARRLESRFELALAADEFI